MSHGKQLTRTMQLLAAERGDMEDKEDRYARVLAELQRFQEREPLVQAVLSAGFDWIDEGTIHLRVPGKLHDALVALAAAYGEKSEGT